MKLILLSLALAGALLPASAETQTEGNYLHVKTAQGWKILNLDKVDRLEFKGGVMTAKDTNQAVVETFPQTDLETMVFSEVTETPSGVSQLPAATEKSVFAFSPATGSILMLADGDLSVYSLDGSKLVEIKGAVSGQTIDLSAIEAEVVIVKSGNQSLKAVIK